MCAVPVGLPYRLDCRPDSTLSRSPYLAQIHTISPESGVLLLSSLSSFDEALRLDPDPLNSDVKLELKRGCHGSLTVTSSVLVYKIYTGAAKYLYRNPMSGRSMMLDWNMIV